MTTITPPTPMQSTPPLNWREKPGARIRHKALSIAILVLASFVDVALAKTTLNLALRLPEPISWAIAICLGLVAVAAAFTAGIMHRKRQALMTAIATAGTLLIALALFTLRLGSGSAETGGSYEGAEAATSTGASESVLAPVMLLIFLATSALAFIDGWRLTDPDRQNYLELLNEMEQARDTVSAQAGRVRHLQILRDQRVNEIANVDRDRRNALLAREALADQLQEWARIEVARVLGDPRATSGIHTPAPRVTTDKTADPMSPTTEH